jgi:flagellar hook-basal body complex protein FliE
MINGLLSNTTPIEPIIKPVKPGGTEAVEGKNQENFSDMLMNSLKEVNDLQKSADQQIENVILGSENTSPHGAMIALEKADMAFQMMSAIRSKIIRAYEEVIRTQV